MALHPLSEVMYASSSWEEVGYSGTSIPPVAWMAWSAMIHLGRLSEKMATLSPRLTPRAVRPAANSRLCRLVWPQVVERKSATGSPFPSNLPMRKTCDSPCSSAFAWNRPHRVFSLYLMNHLLEDMLHREDRPRRAGLPVKGF